MNVHTLPCSSQAYQAAAALLPGWEEIRDPRAGVYSQVRSPQPSPQRQPSPSRPLLPAQASSVATALHEIFELCLSLCRMLSYVEHGAAAEATYRSQFATVSREFSRQAAFLFAFLSNMSSPQASPHLAQLLLRLNFNEFFLQEGAAQGRD